MQVRLTKDVAGKCQEFADALGHSPTELANMALKQMFDLCEHPLDRNVPLLCDMVDTARAHGQNKRPLQSPVVAAQFLNDRDLGADHAVPDPIRILRKKHAGHG
jgi:hypothetical protein